MEQGKLVICVACSSSIVVTDLTREGIVSPNSPINKNYFTLCASICAVCDAKLSVHNSTLSIPTLDKDCIVGTGLISTCTVYTEFSLYCHKVCKILTYEHSIFVPVLHRSKVLHMNYNYIYSFGSYDGTYSLEWYTGNFFGTNELVYSNVMDYIE